jgi:hypothetical protein
VGGRVGSYDQKIYSMILEVFGISSKQSMKKTHPGREKIVQKWNLIII